MSGFIQTNTIPCPPQSYIVSSTNISSDVDVTAPAGFEISQNQITWIAPPGFIRISQNGPSSIPPTTLYVRLNTAVLGTYTGNIVHISTDSPTLLLPVDGIRSAKSPTTTTLSSNLNPSAFGQSITLTADVSSPLPGTPTGTVTFYDGGTPLGTSTLNISANASLSTSALTFGSHDLTATFNADATFDTSTSSTVNQFVQGTTTTVVASNNNPSVFGQSVTLTATVSSSFPGSPTGSVTFYDGVSSLGSAVLSGGNAAISTSGLAPGSHSVTASYVGDVFFAGSISPVLDQKVKATTLVGLASDHNPSVSGQPVTLTASVTSITPGTITGTVTFFDGVNPLGAPVTIASGTATYLAVYTASGGSHSFTASFNGDANFSGSTSSVINQTVNKADVVATVSANPNPSYVGQSVTISTIINPIAPGSGTPTGSILFSIDGSPFGPVSMTGGIASMATSSLTLGLHTITGSYGGNGDFNAVISSVYADTVDPIITATTDPQGSISPSGPVLAPYGGNQTFNITPAIGYQVDSLFIDGAGQAGAEAYTFFNVTTNHTIHATFIQSRFPVTVIAGSNGSATPSGVVMVQRADSLVIQFIPDPHYHVADVLLDDVSVGAVPFFTLRNVIAEHTITVSFAINTYTITATAGAHGSISPSGSVAVPYGSGQGFIFTPDDHYAIDSVIVDGFSVGASNMYTFSVVSADHSIAVYFKLSAVYETRYRTFVYDSLTVKKAVPKKPVTQYWEFTLQNTLSSDVTEINVIFANDVKEIISTNGSFTGTGSKKTWRFSGGILHPSEPLVIKGRSTKARMQLISKLYLGPITRTPNAKSVAPDRQWSELPMPNMASVRDLAFAQAGFATQPWIIGVAKSSPDSSKYYGWVALKKSNDMYKSLFNKGPHTLIGKGFDLLGSRPFVKAQSSLPPTKHNDKTFADLLTLKFNILLSQLGITTRGFGELRLNAPASPFTGMLVREIAAAGDSMMTYHDTYGGQIWRYNNLDSLLCGLNTAFSGVLDTSSWADSLRLQGTNRLKDIPYLSPSGIIPLRVEPQSGVDLLTAEDMPEVMRLDQNFPNPFNPTTTIQFSLVEDQILTLKVYNIMGQEMAILIDHQLFEAGMNEVTFDANQMASGVYYYSLSGMSLSDPVRSFTLTRRMLLIK